MGRASQDLVMPRVQAREGYDCRQFSGSLARFGLASPAFALKNLFLYLPPERRRPRRCHLGPQQQGAACGAHWICHCWLRLVVLQVWITTDGKLVKFFLRSRHLPLGGLRIWPETV